MRVTIFDYGAGNIHSLEKAIALTGASVTVETDARRCTETDLLVLPGVGAFAQAAERLAPGLTTVRDALRKGLPAIGICLGMQLLFDRSDEGQGQGIGLITGEVTKLKAARVPQIGWNTIEEPRGSRDLLLARAGLTTAYYANGFVCRPSNPASVVAWSTHEGDRYPAMVRAERVVGVQFHPEKSSAAGVKFLHAAIDEAR